MGGDGSETGRGPLAMGVITVPVQACSRGGRTKDAVMYNQSINQSIIALISAPHQQSSEAPDET